MKRVDADGFAPGNLFTDGDPQASIQSTLIEETWLNVVQEEIANAVEFSGQVLDQSGADDEQLRKAIEIIALGGSGLSNVSVAIANNQVGTSLGATFLFDKLIHVAVFMSYRIHRQTDSANNDEVGEIKLMYRPVQDDWQLFIDRNTEDDPSAVDFSISAGGQLSYDSSNMAGANYAGTFKVPRILRVNI